jgi:hypothetical protein
MKLAFDDIKEMQVYPLNFEIDWHSWSLTVMFVVCSGGWGSNGKAD